MLNIYKIENELLTEIEPANVTKDCWISLTKPTQDEINNVINLTNIPEDYIRYSLDENEHSRIEFEEEHILLIVNIPIKLDQNRFDTMPIGVILTKDFFITVCLKQNNIIDKFKNQKAKGFIINRRTRFLFQILSRSAELYLRYMRYINNLTDELEIELRKSTKNITLFQLFELEKSLIYFITALKDNAIVMQKLLRLRSSQNYKHILDVYEDDEDLLEDVIIENKQAIEMVEMHSNILGSMMDAFASIISNNLNIVMKVLTSVTILLAIPTMIASFWGMNVDVPWRNHVGGFDSVVLLAVIVTSGAFFFLYKKRMF